MLSIKTFEYNKNNRTTIDNIKNWHFGSDWPSVYIIYNSFKAYVGETLDAVRRTEQHFTEKEFDAFTNICLISGSTFNKSVVLDLESFLIKYISAEGTKQLINGNAGIVDHNYFYKEAYTEDFKEIWQNLITNGIVNKSLIDIENSELFKYSPYKSLNKEQLKVSFEMLGLISGLYNNHSYKSIIKVNGGAGTGKTILAVYLIKLIFDINNNKKIWNSIEDEDDELYLRSIAGRLSGLRKIGFVVPMKKLREIMKKIFNSIDGLSEDMVLSPKEVVKNHYNLLIVDEAHRLYRRKNLPKDSYKDFDEINLKLMGDSFTKSENDLTELDWIIKSSDVQVLFYDELQTIRKTDIGIERFNKICNPLLEYEFELTSQMRCKGGNGYYEYIRHILEDSYVILKDYKKIANYQTHVFDNVEELFTKIDEYEKEVGLCKVICGPGWNFQEKIVIDGKEYAWDKEITSIHKTQGFDLNYAGIIFGKEIYYSDFTKRIEVNKKELQDKLLKDNNDIDGDEKMRIYLINIYTVLMTRGIHGTFVYAVDSKLRDYLKTFLN